MQRVGDLLKLFLSKRLDREGERMAELVAAWPEAAGDAAAHVRVRDLRSGTIVAEADHPGWSQLLLMRKSSILRRLRERFPELDLREIRVMAGPRAPEGQVGGGMAARGRERGWGGKPSPGDPGIEESLERLPDEGLRRSLRSLYEEAADGGERPEGRDKEGPGGKQGSRIDNPGSGGV